ncbi:MAG: hypothetical protein E6H79_15385 [Betaproteobacteria bacterium]|nr:MAG: hypothetical protein E6H79_15385 [Betaproteobacteria bacterium]
MLDEDSSLMARRDALALALPAAINMLWKCRAADVPPGHLDDYVALGWMRWAAGRLIITPQGAAVRDTVIAREQ